MFSTGAINGAAINVEAINGGHMVQLAVALAAVAVSPLAITRRRARAAGVLGVVVGGAAAANRRQRFAGAASVSVVAAAEAHRRTHGAGEAMVLLTPISTARRRLVRDGSAPVIVGGEADTTYRFIHRAPARRTFALPAQWRGMTVQSEQRCATLPGPRAPFIVPRANREAP